MFNKEESYLLKQIIDRILLHSYDYDVGLQSKFIATFLKDEILMLHEIQKKLQ